MGPEAKNTIAKEFSRSKETGLPPRERKSLAAAQEEWRTNDPPNNLRDGVYFLV